MIVRSMLISAGATAVLASGILSANALEKVKVATSFIGLWDTSQPTYCKERGEFEKAGLDVEIASTRGGSENVQAVIAGGMDIGYSPGVNAALAAYMQGSKMKIIGSEFKGQNDTFFYVTTDSPIKSMKDIAGKSVAYPRPGGASEGLLVSLKNDTKLDFKPVATGGLDATYTMTMTKQVDVGYSFPPTMLDAVDSGKIRVVFSGDDVPSQRNITGRVNVANADFLKNRHQVATKFFEVLDKCIDWAYANRAEAAKWYAALNKTTPAVADKALGYYRRDMLAFGPVTGMDEIIKSAIEGKVIDKAPTAEQLKDMMDIVYTSKK